MFLQADVWSSIREKIRALTHIEGAQETFGTRGRTNTTSKFLLEVIARCEAWSVSKRFVYALVDAYLDFELAGPVRDRSSGRGALLMRATSRRPLPLARVG